jgi:hypothetical protein
MLLPLSELNRSTVVWAGSGLEADMDCRSCNRTNRGGACFRVGRASPVFHTIMCLVWIVPASERHGFVVVQ